MIHFENKSNSIYNHLKGKLLISCPRDPQSEGGLYVLDFSLKNISKILTADCRGITRDSDFFYLATNSHGILKLDEQFNIISTFDVPSLDLHGLRYHRGKLYVVETKHNVIGIYQTEPFNKIDEIKISPSDDDQNHINDIWIDGDSLYVSMFSFNGGWRKIEGAYDGVIAEYNIQSKSLVKIVQKNLQLPHSILKYDEKIIYCESFNMNLKENDVLLAQFNGFTRGLAFDGVNFYIGQSQMRHLDKILSKNTNVSLDCGIHVFNSKMRTNQFIQFPENQIYEILVLEDNSIIESSISLDFSDPNITQFIKSEEWHEPEEAHRWMKHQEASIKFKIKFPLKKLTIDAYNGFPGEYKVTVLLNNKFIGEIIYENAEAKISDFQVSGYSGEIEIQIVTEKMWCPADVLFNKDTRQLGLALKNLTLKTDL